MTETATKPPFPGPAVNAGFGATLVLWLVWWVTHLPGVHADPRFEFFLLSLTLLASLALFARTSPTPLRTGLLGGLIAGVLNLLILGSVLAVQVETTDQMTEAANRFRDEAWAMTAGYLALTLAAGGLGGLIGRATRVRRPATSPTRWLARFAVLTCVSFLPLLVVGGAVTSTESGMSVPDGWTSYGAFSALLPMSVMAEPRIFLEHTHRLFGTLVGLTAIALLIYTALRERRLVPKIFAGVLLAFVTLQGIFGAIRVGESLAWLAIVHGVFAQLVLAFAVVVACKLSELDRSPPSEFDPRTMLASRRAERLTHIAAWALLLQLILGAVARHSENPAHAIWSHVGFSIVVVALVVIGSAVLRTADPETRPGRLLRRIGGLLTLTVFCQFVLGFLTLWQVGVSGEPRPIPTADQLASAHRIDVVEAIITTAHQSLGATLLALIALGVYWSKRIRKLADKAAARVADEQAAAVAAGA